MPSPSWVSPAAPTLPACWPPHCPTSTHRSPGGRSAQDEHQEHRREDNGLKAVHTDADQRAPIAAAGVRDDERIEQVDGDRPWNVQVIEAEEDTVRQPVPPAEGTSHTRQ